MAEKKTTQMEMFARIAEMAKANDDMEMVEFAEKKMEQLEKRKNAPRKPRFNIEANEFAKQVITVLEGADEPVTNKQLTELMNAANPGLEKPISAQKVAAALRKIEAKQVMDVDEYGELSPVEGIDLIVTEGEKKSDPKTFAIFSI